MTNWSTDELKIAREMRDDGATSREIGEHLGRTAAAVRTVLSNRGESMSRREWLESHSHETIEHCPTQRRLIEDAIVGSHMLKVAILTAIVRQGA